MTLASLIQHLNISYITWLHNLLSVSYKSFKSPNSLNFFKFITEHEVPVSSSIITLGLLLSITFQPVQRMNMTQQLHKTSSILFTAIFPSFSFSFLLYCLHSSFYLKYSLFLISKMVGASTTVAFIFLCLSVNRLWLFIERFYALIFQGLSLMSVSSNRAIAVESFNIVWILQSCMSQIFF